MPESALLNWTELLGLHVVRKVAKLVGKRWGLGVGYIDAGREFVSAPKRRKALGPFHCRVLQDRSHRRHGCQDHAQATLQAFQADSSKAVHSTTCFAGLQEIAAPVVVDGVFLGALLCGGFSVEEQQVDGLPEAEEGSEAAVPLLSLREVSIVQDLVEEAAAEIVAFLLMEGCTVHGDESPLRDRYQGIIGSAAPMQALYNLLDRVVESDSTVLITGENGTGKELVARAIHFNSARKDENFVVQNCSAFNDSLLDSELFGHKRGAFTGAVADKKGLFEVADKGTFFLDEIGDMSPALQVKVLRVLQEGTFTPVGGTESRHVNVRVLAATNRDLGAMVKEGSFREDLFYRINVIQIELPALRERRDDLAILTEHFLHKHGGDGKRLGADCIELLGKYDWPGNVRELENEIERLTVLSGSSPVLAAELLSPRMRSPIRRPKVKEHFDGRSLPMAVQALERHMIRNALIDNDWNKTRAASQLEVSRRNLIRLVQKYELDAEREDFSASS